MRIDLNKAYISYFSFKFLHAAIDEMIAVDCFYNDQLQDFFFRVNIAGITQKVSCADNCGCKGRKIGYQNCQSCCCQRRVIDKETPHGRFK